MATARVLVLIQVAALRAATTSTRAATEKTAKIRNRDADGRAFAANPLANRPRIPSRVFPIFTRTFMPPLSVRFAHPPDRLFAHRAEILPFVPAPEVIEQQQFLILYPRLCYHVILDHVRDKVLR